MQEKAPTPLPSETSDVKGIVSPAERDFFSRLQNLVLDEDGSPIGIRAADGTIAPLPELDPQHLAELQKRFLNGGKSPTEH